MCILLLHQVVYVGEKFICPLYAKIGLELLEALEHIWSKNLQMWLFRSLTLDNC